MRPHTTHTTIHSPDRALFSFLVVIAGKIEERLIFSGQGCHQGDNMDFIEMTTPPLSNILPTLFAEIVFGSPNPETPTFMLNRGDAGLLASLDRITFDAASMGTDDGASIAAHVEHLRYGFAILNRWVSGEEAPWANADWTQAWKTRTVTEAEWQTLRDELRREAESWSRALAEPREMGNAAARWVTGSVAHTAYHLGAIRQIGRAARGPTAEDEKPYQSR